MRCITNIVNKMDYHDRFSPTEENEFGNELGDNDVQRMLNLYDKGYNTVYRQTVRADGRTKQTKITLYTSGGIGTRIRDAETGHFYNRMVGSKHEDGFFKVALATGECRSKNGSNTMFFASPSHYFSHMKIAVDENVEQKWIEIEKKWAEKNTRYLNNEVNI
jgi:hypothetical protein